MFFSILSTPERNELMLNKYFYKICRFCISSSTFDIKAPLESL